MKLQHFMTSVAVAALMAGGAAAQTVTPNPDASPQAPIVEPMFTSIDQMTVGDVIGTFVYSPDGDSIGEIDYVVEQGGTIAAVIGIGGFLGLGEYTVALPLEEFMLREDGISFELAAEKEALKAMPEFDETGVESLERDLLIAELMPARESDGESTAMDTSAPKPAAEADTEVAAEADAEVDAEVEEMAEGAETELEATGEEIAGTAGEVGEMAEEAGEEMAAEVDSAVESAGDAMTETAENAETAMEETGDEVAEAADDVGTAMEETGEEMAEAADEAVDGAETAIDEAGEELATEMPATGMADPNMADSEMADAVPASVDEMTVGEVIGTIAYDPSGNKIGEIDYVIAADSGAAAVIGIGGFIGLGEYTVALPIDEFKLSDDGSFFTLATDKETLKAQPEIDETGLESVDSEILIRDLKQGKVDVSSSADG